MLLNFVCMCIAILISDKYNFVMTDHSLDFRHLPRPIFETNHGYTFMGYISWIIHCMFIDKIVATIHVFFMNALIHELSIKTHGKVHGKL